MGWQSLMLVFFAVAFWLLWPRGNYAPVNPPPLPEATVAYIELPTDQSSSWSWPDTIAMPSATGFSAALNDDIEEWELQLNRAPRSFLLDTPTRGGEWRSYGELRDMASFQTSEELPPVPPVFTTGNRSRALTVLASGELAASGFALPAEFEQRIKDANAQHDPYIAEFSLAFDAEGRLADIFVLSVDGPDALSDIIRTALRAATVKNGEAHGTLRIFFGDRVF